jgi:Spy/CpxP family protein refolding chaperone
MCFTSSGERLKLLQEDILMKAILIVVLSITVASASAFAGNGGGGRGQGNRGVTRMQQDLGLSNEQVRQIRQIRQNGGSREEAHAVMTEQQRAMANERRGQGQGRGANPPEPDGN